VGCGAPGAACGARSRTQARRTLSGCCSGRSALRGCAFAAQALRWRALAQTIVVERGAACAGRCTARGERRWRCRGVRRSAPQR
jgi:hypothetical protein